MATGKVNVIAIDGPAGSGKSTVAKEVAARLGYLYVDTGAMYRALTLKAMNEKLDMTDEEALIGLSKKMDIRLKDSRGALSVYLDKKDVTEQIRTMEVTSKVRLLSGIKGVRDNMVRHQRKLGLSSRGAVLEGRDIGTVVFPDAKYKFYLDASMDTRIKRRFNELKEKGFSVSIDEITKDVVGRDKSDMTRSVGPLKKSKDAVLVDTTNMKITEVVDKVLATVTEKSV